MSLTPEQRDQAVDYFDGHALLREAADMLQVPWSSFADDWREGKRDAEAGRGGTRKPQRGTSSAGPLEAGRGRSFEPKHTPRQVAASRLTC